MSTTTVRQIGAGLSIRPLTPSFGAEIIGADLSQPLSDEVAKIIHDSWIEAGLLLFRGENQDDEAQMRLSRLFGEMEPSAIADMNDPSNKYLMSLIYDPSEPTARPVPLYNVGGIDRAGWLGWHWDQSFMPTIVRGAVLRMTHPSREMGETGFIDAIDAYERLPEALKQRIEGLEVVYQFNPDFCTGQYGFPKDIRRLEQPGGKSVDYDFPPVVHPLVITQQETGRKVLKLSPMHARYILGMDKAESDALLTTIADHLVDPAYAYFHSWQKNDMLVWDNWRTIHGANGHPLDCERRGRRTTIMGDYEVGRYLDPTLDRNRVTKRIVD